MLQFLNMATPSCALRVLPLFVVSMLIYPGCDHGIAPPTEAPIGAIRGSITYVGGESVWPPSDSLFDLRFFALPFVPCDSLDLFRDLNQLVFSDRLQYGTASDSFAVDSVNAQYYLYSGVAQQYSRNLLDWRPVGLVDMYRVRVDEVVELAVTADFHNPPLFPPDCKQ